MKTKKHGGGWGGGCSIYPWKKPKQKPVFLFEFWVDPLNWLIFIEIGEMACSTIARCSRGHALKVKHIANGYLQILKFTSL